MGARNPVPGLTWGLHSIRTANFAPRGPRTYGLWRIPFPDETIYPSAFPITSPANIMLPVVIVLVLLTALVATEPPSPGGSDN